MYTGLPTARLTDRPRPTMVGRLETRARSRHDVRSSIPLRHGISVANQSQSLLFAGQIEWLRSHLHGTVRYKHLHQHANTITVVPYTRLNDRPRPTMVGNLDWCAQTRHGHAFSTANRSRPLNFAGKIEWLRSRFYGVLRYGHVHQPAVYIPD